MKTPSQMTKTATMVEGALMVAIAFMLSFLPVLPMPMGGTATILSTLPIIMMSFRHSPKWGVGTALVYSLLQALQGLENIVFHKQILSLLLCLFLDYVLAYTCIGFAGAISNGLAKLFKKDLNVAFLGAAVLLTGIARLLCSTLSGILLYSAYLPTDKPLFVASLIYNATWCVPDVLFVFIAVLILGNVKVLGMLGSPKNATAQ